MHLDIINTQNLDRDSLLLQKIQSREKGATIVYVHLANKTSMEVATKFTCLLGLKAQAYHAGMKDEQRSEIQEWFHVRGKIASFVATIAFGMGIDKANIRYVYHYNLPKSLEGYAQEIGRAGRDGLPSICTMLVKHL